MEMLIKENELMAEGLRGGVPNRGLKEERKYFSHR